MWRQGRMILPRSQVGIRYVDFSFWFICPPPKCHIPPKSAKIYFHSFDFSHLYIESNDKKITSQSPLCWVTKSLSDGPMVAGNFRGLSQSAAVDLEGGSWQVGYTSQEDRGYLQFMVNFFIGKLYMNIWGCQPAKFGASLFSSNPFHPDLVFFSHLKTVWPEYMGRGDASQKHVNVPKHAGGYSDIPTTAASLCFTYAKNEPWTKSGF